MAGNTLLIFQRHITEKRYLLIAFADVVGTEKPKLSQKDHGYGLAAQPCWIYLCGWVFTLSIPALRSHANLYLKNDILMMWAFVVYQHENRDDTRLPVLFNHPLYNL